MSIDKITTRILQEARDDAEATRQSAEQEAAAQKAKAEKEAEALKEETAKKAVEDAAVLKERRGAVAELEARKLRLAARQEMIEQSFEMAKDVLLKMDDSAYQNFLLKQLAPYSAGEVILNARDKKRLGKALTRKLNGTGLKVSATVADIEGGFILRDGPVSINASMESLLENERKEITSQIAKTLFA